MKTRLTTWILGLLLMAPCVLFADETITVTATDSDISANLDLKAVATLFGEAKNLEEFEQKLNDSDDRISNLDLNGDGQVDYLRVVETTEDNAHLIVLQAVLAKDIYQDVASIYVDKDETTQQVTVQVIGDEYLYGTNYVIEPVYVYTPVIYDWFWGPSWYCWHSPYYWGYYPHYWHAYDCWLVHDYWHHIYDYHHHHPYCSYRTRPEPAPRYATMRPGVSRYDYATLHPERSFSQRNASNANVRNARDLQPQRSTRDASTVRGASSRTFDSSYGARATRVNSASTSSRSAAATSTSRSATAGSTSRSAATTGTATRSATGSATRTATTTSRSATTGTAARSAATTATTTRRTSTTAVSSTGRSTGSSVSRSASGTSSRSTVSTSTNRSQSSGVSRAASTSSRSNIQSSTRSSSSVSRSSSAVSGRSSSSVSRGSSSVSSGRSSSYSGGSSRSSVSGGSSRGSVSGGGSRSGGSTRR